MPAQVHGFQTEVAKLLSLLANSLYSNKEVFLRELVSNASDAIDKLRFLSITQPDLVKDDPVFSIRVKADKEKGLLTISDNGIGMTLEQANEHLGTIAKSGTEDFMKSLSGDQAKDSELIGQFGVGFYSAFIVADRVTVYSRAATAGADEGVRWSSDGSGTFESEQIHHEARGTEVVLHLKSTETGFLDSWTLREAITRYSDHISAPVMLWDVKPEVEDAKEGDKDEKKEPVYDWIQVNEGKALWTKTPKDVTESEYKEFYKHLTHDWEDPLTWAHNRVEGDLEYTSLLYIPKQAPWDLFSREMQHGLKLFIQRVFIMDKAESFLPNYLRFVRGLIDTNELPLNVSRELLQDSIVTRKLKKALTKRALTMIEKLAAEKDKYADFWATFGRVLKEGTVEDPASSNQIMKLLRFASTKEESAKQTVSLADYIGRMKEKQTKIYYLVANSYESAINSPYLESLKKKDIEVLLMWERVDEWMMGNTHDFEGKEFVSVTESDLKLGELEDKKDEEKKDETNGAIERFKKALGDKVTDVRLASRLVDSPSCVVSDGPVMTSQMRRMFEAAGQPVPEDKFILEVNVSHPIVAKALAESDETKFATWAEFIFSQALLADQGSLKDPSAFIKSLNALIAG